MRLDKFNMGGVQCYTITNPSSEFKKLYPKNWIVCSISKNQVVNVDKINDLAWHFSDSDYAFCYSQNTKDKKSTRAFDMFFGYFGPRNIESITSTFDGHNYFIGDKLESDLVLKIVPKTDISDPRLMNSIVIRNKCDFMKDVDLKQSIKLLLKQTYNDKYLKTIDTTEKWLISFLKELPFDLNNEPLKFPSKINDQLFKSKLNLDINNFKVGYCMRTNMKNEINMVREIEQQLTPRNQRRTIYENYNKIVERIAEEAKKHKMKYTLNPGISISIKTSDLDKLNLDYTVTDFIK